MDKNNSKSTNSKSTTNWDFSFYKVASNNLPDPYGFNTSIVESNEARSRRKDISHVKQSKAQELAYGGFKNVIMTIISFYFIGSGLSLITIFIVGLYGYNSLTSIISVNSVFKPYESPEYSLLQFKLVYILIQSLTFFFVIYRIYGMGLIPLNPADWISILDLTTPTNRMINH